MPVAGKKKIKQGKAEIRGKQGEKGLRTSGEYQLFVPEKRP